MEPVLKIAEVKQECNPDRIEIYLCFDAGNEEHESHVLFIEEFIGDTKAQFADSLEVLAKKLRDS